MSNNRTFFKNAKEGQMTLKDIFSDVTRKHTPEESARVFIAGTALTTPDESEMLAGWQKPFLFARFFLFFLVGMVLCLVLGELSPGGTDALMASIAIMVPMTTLLLAYEMNIPRSISLMETLKIVAIGGLLSLIFTLLLRRAGVPVKDASWAPIVEEPAKLMVIYLLLKKKNYKYILEGVLLGMAVGTGFAIVETLNYIMSSARDGMIISMTTLLLEWANKGGADAAVQQLISVVNNQLDALNQLLLADGAASGMNTAISRSINGIVGHGVYAALYGGGLMMAKQAEPVKLSHLLHKDFIRFFAASCLIHYLNNSRFSGTEYFPWIIEGTFRSWSLVKTALGAIFLLPLLKAGVNQVVEATIAHHGGRVTRAVNQEAAVLHQNVGGGSSQGPSGRIEFLSGPLAGQSFPIQAGQKVTIGRAPTCTIPVSGVSHVSGTHCAIAVNGSMIIVTDLGSTNGTYVGNQRLAPQKATPVPDGGTVYLGNQNCAIRVSVR